MTAFFIAFTPLLTPDIAVCVSPFVLDEVYLYLKDSNVTSQIFLPPSRR